jgi:hypothetical protein
MKCEQKVKSVLYEVSLYLADNSHDYEARELHDKVSRLMNDEDFEEGKREHGEAGAARALAKAGIA